MNNLEVINAEYLDGYKLKLVFSDKTVKVVDFGNFLIKKPHPQYSKYLDIPKFKDFKIEMGNVVWGENWDLIFPLSQLYRGKITY